MIDRNLIGRREGFFLILLAGVLCYLSSFRGVFLFDDHLSIVLNDNLQDLRLLPNIFLNESRPVVALTFAVNYTLGGINAIGYHVVNLMIHVINGFLLFCIVRKLLQTKDLADRYGKAAGGLALAISLIWLVHPIQTESVTYIVQRYESMAAAFYLLVLYSAFRGFDSPHRRFWWHSAAVLFFILGMGSKETVITAPFMVLICEIIFLGKSFKRALSENRWFYATLALGLFLSVWWRMQAPLDYETAGFGMKNVRPLNYAMTQLSVLAHYLKLVFWPTDLCFDYRWPIAQSIGQVFPQGLITILLLIATAVGLKFKPRLAFFGIWFFLILAPTSSFLPLEDAAFEHRMYLASASLVAAAVIGGFELIVFGGRYVSGLHQRAGIFSALFVLVVVAVLGSLTFQRNLDYQNEMKIWLDVLKQNPRNPRAHHQVGFSLEKQGHLSEAIEYYRYALQLEPDYWEVYLKLGEAYYQQGRIEQAFESLRKAIAIQPKAPILYFRLGTFYLQQGDLDPAIKWFHRVLEMAPKAYRTCNNLGIAYLQQGNSDRAIYYFKKALEIKPKYSSAQENLERAMRVFTGQ